MKTKIISIIMFAVLIYSCEKDITTDTLKVGLIAYYPFNGNANDESNNSYDGAVFGATLTNDRFGNTNKSYSFNGIDNYILLPITFDTLPRSIDLWINVVDRNYFDSYGAIYQSDNKDLLYGNSGIAVKNIDNKNKLLLTISAVTDTIDFIADNWYNVAIVAETTKKLRFYINGDLLGNKQFDNYLTSINVLNKTIIGANRFASGNYFKGIIDDIRVYSRVLTDREISKLSNLNE